MLQQTFGVVWYPAHDMSSSALQDNLHKALYIMILLPNQSNTFSTFRLPHVHIFLPYIDWFSGTGCWWLGCWLGTNPVSCQREGMELVLIIILVTYHWKKLFRRQVLCWLQWYKSLLYSSWPLWHSIHPLSFLVSFDHYFSALVCLLCCYYIEAIKSCLVSFLFNLYCSSVKRPTSIKRPLFPRVAA